MTKREKVLIIIGLSVLILFGSFNFLLVPAYETYEEKFERFEQLSFEKMLAETDIANEYYTKLAYEKAYEECEEKRQLVSPKLTNQEIDRLITGICLNQGLVPKSLSVVSANPEKADSSTEPGILPGVMIAQVKVRVTSGYRDLQRLIDKVNESSYISISAMSYKYEVSEATGEPDIQADIDFSVLMESA